MKKVTVFYDSRITVEGCCVKWNDRTCFVSAVSQIWVGNPDVGRWKRKGAQGREGLNLELVSGSVYTFLSDDHEFLLKAYELLCRLVLEGGGKGENRIDFERHSIQLPEDLESREAVAQPPVPVYSGNDLIQQELAILKEHCGKKEGMGTEVQQFLEELTACYAGNCKRNIQELYKLFVQLSLVNDCNELGLSSLIEEVKSKVFR